MLSKGGIERIAGILLLLLPVFVIVSIVTKVEIDTDIDEFRGSLQDIANDSGRHLIGVSFALIADLLAVALAGAFYLVFRSHERSLALLAAFGFLAMGLMFAVEEMSGFALYSLAKQFETAVNPAADSIVTSALAIALIGEFAHEIAITFFGLAVLLSGVLIVRSGAVHRLIGWPAGLGGFLMLFHWLRFLQEDRIFIARVGLIGTLIFFLLTGIWLLLRGTQETATE